mmetsp:Transcript_6459/g.16731  ORF Transcript_6459/g.16731 Transcript_6459/m.16731 type:complete len:555 (+) Transcript_6459:414-2078(+)
MLASAHLVDLLHAGALVHIVLLKRRQILVLRQVIQVLVDGQAQLHHAVDAARESVGLIQREAARQQSGLKQQQDQVLHRLVALVCVGALAQLAHDGVVRVDLQRLLAAHVRAHGVVAQRLRLHDALHVGAPAVLARHQHARRVHNAVADHHLLHLVAQDVLHQAAQRLILRLHLLLLLLLLLCLLQLQPLLSAAHQLLAVVLLQLLHGVLINGVHHEQHLKTLLLQLLQEGAVLHRGAALASDVVDGLLLLLHARDVVLQAGHLVAALGGVVAQQLRQLGAVLAVLVNAQLEVLAERLVELGKVILVLGNLVKQLQALLGDVLLDDLEDLVLLQHLARNVERQVLAVDDALHKAQVLGDQVLAVIHDEHAAHVQLQVVTGPLLAIKHVEGGALGHKQHALELQLALHREVLPGQGLLPVVGERLVEGGVLVLGDLLGVAHPDGLLLVEQVPLMGDLLDGLCRLLLLGGVVDLLNLALLVLVFRVHVDVFVVADLLVDRLLSPVGDGVADELAVLLHKVLDAALLQVLHLVLLQVQHYLGTAAQGLALRVARHSK